MERKLSSLPENHRFKINKILGKQHFDMLSVKKRVQVLYSLCESLFDKNGRDPSFQSQFRQICSTETQIDPIGKDSFGRLYYNFSYGDCRICKFVYWSWCV